MVRQVMSKRRRQPTVEHIGSVIGKTRRSGEGERGRLTNTTASTDR